MQERERQTDSGQVAVPKPAEEPLTSVLEVACQSNEKRFSCAHCGQHYAVDTTWPEQDMVCLRCGRSFRPESPPRPDRTSRTGGPGDTVTQPTPTAPRARAVPAAIPYRGLVRTIARAGDKTRTGGGILPHLSVQVLALFTPLMVAGAMSLGLLFSLVLRPLFVVGLLASPVIGYFVSVKLCRQVCRSGGTIALQRYLRGAVLSFVLWGLLGFGAACLRAEQPGDSAGLLVVPFLFAGAIGFVVVFITWGWSASRVWAAETGDEGPSVPWWP